MVLRGGVLSPCLPCEILSEILMDDHSIDDLMSNMSRFLVMQSSLPLIIVLIQIIMFGMVQIGPMVSILIYLLRVVLIG